MPDPIDPEALRRALDELDALHTLKGAGDAR